MPNLSVTKNILLGVIQLKCGAAIPRLQITALAKWAPNALQIDIKRHYRTLLLIFNPNSIFFFCLAQTLLTYIFTFSLEILSYLHLCSVWETSLDVKVQNPLEGA